MSYRLCCGVFNASQTQQPTCSDDWNQPVSENQMVVKGVNYVDGTVITEGPTTQQKEVPSCSSIKSSEKPDMEPSRPTNSKTKGFFSRFKRKKGTGSPKTGGGQEPDTCICTGFSQLSHTLDNNITTDLDQAFDERRFNTSSRHVEGTLIHMPGMEEIRPGAPQSWWDSDSSNFILFHDPQDRHGRDTGNIFGNFPASHISDEGFDATSEASTSHAHLASSPNCIVRQRTVQGPDASSVPQPATLTEFTQVEYVHCLVPDLYSIAGACYYWGVMDRYEAEQLLENKPEGTFLLRDSAQADFLFSVSFRRYGRSLHARIDQEQHQFSFDVHDSGVFRAPTVCSLVTHYKDPACCMFFEPMLSRPLVRNFPFSLKHLTRVAVCKNLDYDSINVLPLPNKLKEYLKYYNYLHKVSVRKLFTVVKSASGRHCSVTDIPVTQHMDLTDPT